jgi:hypothetical protein
LFAIAKRDHKLLHDLLEEAPAAFKHTSLDGLDSADFIIAAMRFSWMAKKMMSRLARSSCGAQFYEYARRWPQSHGCWQLPNSW